MMDEVGYLAETMARVHREEEHGPAQEGEEQSYSRDRGGQL